MNRLLDALLHMALRRPLAVIAATSLAALAGVWAFATITTDAFPDLTPNQVLVMTTVRGMSPVEVEQQVTYPMEVAMLGLPRATGVRSTSKADLSVVTITFEDDVDLYFARTLVQQRMLDARDNLPDGAEPMLGPPATAMGEIFQYVLESDPAGSAAADSARLIALTNAQEYIVRPMLRTVPGVADVNPWGGMRQQFEVLVDPARLAGHGIALADVRAAIAANNAGFGGGYVEDRGERFTLRGLGRLADTADIAGVVLATRGHATPIHLRDVARVTIAPQLRYGAVTRDGLGEAIGATVIMLKGANGHDVAHRIADKLDEIRPTLPAGIRIRPFYDQGEVVERTTRTVFRNLLEGGILVAVLLLLFLRNLRASLLAASVIPLSLLVAFLAMRRGGISANLMSLGALDFGLLVDASIVVIENMIRRLRVAPEARGDARIALLHGAVREVARPVVFGVTIILVVYLPVLALQGVASKMFFPMAFTVCAAVFASLVLALTWVPAMAAVLLTAHGHDEGDDHGWFARLRHGYDRRLGAALAHPRRVVAVAVALLAATVASLPWLGSEFMPKLDEGYLLIESRRAPSASLAQGIAMSGEAERTLRGFPEVAGVVTNLGRPHEATETMALNQGDIYVQLRPHAEWQAPSLDALIERMDSALAEIPGLTYEFSAPMRMRLDEVVSGVKTDLGVRLFGDSLPLLEQKAEEIRAAVERLPGAADVSVGVGAGAAQLQIDANRAALSRYGLQVTDLRDAIETGIGGSEASAVVDGRRRFPIVVRFDPAYRSTPEAIARLPVATPEGGSVTLSQVAAVRTVEGPEAINHEGGQRFVLVQANVRGRDQGSFVADVERTVRERVMLPAGYHVQYEGQFANQTRATRRLAAIVPVALLLIAGLLYANFGAARPVWLVMLNIPFALVGGIAALWLRGLHLNLSAIVGLVAVFGVAILNGLVLVTTARQREADGLSARDAMREAAATRLRPVLATAAVASIGFLPMALSTSSGAEIQRPLATVVIGGIVSSTLLTLVVLPTIYAWLGRSRERRVVSRES